MGGGAVQLTHPLHASTDMGDVNLGGSVGLDQRLHLSGTVALSPKALQGVSAGKWRPASSVSLPMAVGGTVGSPAVQLPSAPQIAQALVSQSPIGGGAGRLGQELKRALPFP